MLQTLTSDATFGPGPTFNTDIGFDIALSQDKKAFTALFGGLEAIIDGNSAPPIVTRVFSFSIPLKDTKPGQEIPFFVSGFATAQKGANAHLIFTVNDQSMVAYLPGEFAGGLRPSAQLQGYGRDGGQDHRFPARKPGFEIGRGCPSECHGDRHRHHQALMGCRLQRRAVQAPIDRMPR